MRAKRCQMSAVEALIAAALIVAVFMPAALADSLSANLSQQQYNEASNFQANDPSSGCCGSAGSEAGAAALGAVAGMAIGAEISEDILAEEVNDPLARLSQFQLKEIYTPAEYGTNSQPNTFQLRPVFDIPPHLFMPVEQLIRPTIQVVTVPRGRGASSTTAFDDLQLVDLFRVPIREGEDNGFLLGFGPYFVFPTSTSQFTGNGAWQAGPAGAFSLTRGRLKIAGLLQQATSFAYTSSRSKSVASIQFQPILAYELGHGWYVKSSDATWKVNLRHRSSTEIPLSAGFGKVWKLNEQCSVNAAVSGEWMAYRQYAKQTEQFSLIFQVSLLLPQFTP